MPLDHELPTLAIDAGPPQQSTQPRPADRAPSANGLPRPSESVLVPCVYIALRCLRCGEIRQALGKLPGDHAVTCPECGQTCSFVLLGSGLTKQKLPFHRIHGTEPTRWDARDETDETNDSS